MSRKFPAVYMSCMSQNFRLFPVSNLSVLNFRIFLLMYPGPLTPINLCALGRKATTKTSPVRRRRRRGWLCTPYSTHTQLITPVERLIEPSRTESGLLAYSRHKYRGDGAPGVFSVLFAGASGTRGGGHRGVAEWRPAVPVPGRNTNCCYVLINKRTTKWSAGMNCRN